VDPHSTLRRAIRLIIREEAANVLDARWTAAPLTVASAGEWGEGDPEDTEDAVDEAEVEEWGGGHGRPSGC